MEEQAVINAFHELYYNSGVWFQNTRWHGVPVQKHPCDLWVYQELLFEIRPDLIIETGTAYGGSALFFASMCELIGKGSIITIDTNLQVWPEARHGLITYLYGSSLDAPILNRVRDDASRAEQVMVILDSDHRKAHVAEELRLYAPLVTKGSYLIVEDTDVNGHPVCPDHGPGPAEAVEEFLKTHPEFWADHAREKFFVTQNPGGYLKRIA